MTTYCRDCDRVHPDTRDVTRPWSWRCLAVRVEPGFGFVDPDHSPTPPYEKCERINRDGDCEFFEPLRTPETADASED